MRGYPSAWLTYLPGQQVTTVKTAGYTSLSNGDLIRRATADGYNVLVTADRNLPAQQNIRASGIAVVLVSGNRLVDIEPNAEVLRETIATAEPGTVARVAHPS